MAIEAPAAAQRTVNAWVLPPEQQESPRPPRTLMEVHGAKHNWTLVVSVVHLEFFYSPKVDTVVKLADQVGHSVFAHIVCATNNPRYVKSLLEDLLQPALVVQQL